MLVLLAVALLAACSSPPGRLLAPVAPDPAATTVDLLAATTRDVDDDPAVLFGGDRGDGVSYAALDVSLPPGRDPGTLQWPRSAPADPAREFAVLAAERIDRSKVRDWLKGHAGRQGRLFVFVHGYNTSFGRAVFRFAQLAHDTDAAAAPVLFSWPSRGRLLDYKRDSDNASYSRSDLGALLETALALPEIREITILAHSLGSWVAMEAVRQVGLAHHGVPSKIRNLVLAAPDLDVGVFRRQLEDMGPRRPQVTLFVASSDRALQVSAILTRGMTRLGAIDPTQEQYREQFAGLSGVTILDLSALRSGDRINHDLYAQSPAVVRLIGDRLLAGQVVTDEDADILAGADGPVAAAAGALVTAPIRIFQAGKPQ
jgi:esterase/lipase superfamily enzyme